MSFKNFRIKNALAFTFQMASILAAIMLFSTCKSHFVVYEVQQSPATIGVVDLNDQFEEESYGTEQVEVIGPVLFCSPAEKKVGNKTYGIADNDHHFTAYRLMNKKHITRNVRIKNQFTEDWEPYTVEEAKYLLVPTQKMNPGNHEPPQKLDHYVCYRIINGEPPGVEVEMKDQFMTYEKRPVGKPEFLCVPAEKVRDNEVTPILNPKKHFVFYRFQEDVGVDAVISNQFQTQFTIGMNKVSGILVESEKKM